MCFLMATSVWSIAEVELSDEDDIFEKPAWLGKEVTGDIRYYNSTTKFNRHLKLG